MANLKISQLPGGDPAQSGDLLPIARSGANYSLTAAAVAALAPAQVTLKTNGVNNGSQSILNLKNGTNVTITDDGVGGLTIAAATAATTPYIVAATLNGLPSASLVLLRIPASVTYTVPAGGTNSELVLGVAATASTVFTMYKNGVSFGTITVSASGTTGTFAVASPTVFAVGDVLTVTAPASPDATAADIGLSIYATR
jgi:hypothetical protein